VCVCVCVCVQNINLNNEAALTRHGLLGYKKNSFLGTPKSLALFSPHFSEGKTYKPKNIHGY